MSASYSFTSELTHGNLGAFLASSKSFAAHHATTAGVPVLPPRNLNTSVYLDINHFSEHTAWAHSFMAAYALWLGPALLATVFVAAYAVAWWRRNARAGGLLVLGAVGTIVALGLNQLVGHAAKELRPYVTHPHALVLVAKANDYSFPSDHSIVAGGLTVALFLVLGDEVWRRRAEGGSSRTERAASRRAIGVLAAINVVFGLFLCFARIYVGAHYPGDVVAGYLLASVVVLVVSLLRRLVYRAVDVIEPTVLGIVLRRPVPALSRVPVHDPIDETAYERDS